MSKKILSIFLILCMTAIMLFGDSYGVFRRRRSAEEKMFDDALILWYTDEKYGEYLRDAAVAYEMKTGVKVIPTQVSDVDYLEQIQNATTNGTKSPSLFVLPNDQLEKAVLSGLAAETRDPDAVLNSAFYADAGLRGVTYRDKTYGYPLSYESAFVIYNETVMEEIAANIPEPGKEGDTEGITLVDESTAEETSEEVVELTEEEKLALEATAKEILPTSVVGILDFAKQYSLPEGVESYFLWDTKDVLYNYWFAGAYLSVGGENSDKSEDINMYNENALYSLSVYQDFREFFSMDEDSEDYSQTIDDFIHRKCVFTVAGTDIISRMEEAKASGEFTDEYDILPIGMLNGTLQSKGLSVTTMVCVNGLSEDRTEAERFAAFVTTEYAAYLYPRCNKMSAAHLKEYLVPQMKTMEDCYEHTIAIPKMVETSNYYMLVEMCFSNVWDGKDVNAELKSLSESVLRNYYGADFSHETIETPEVLENYNDIGDN